MSSFAHQLSSELPSVALGPPASQDEICLAERTLGRKLPEKLREIYASCGTVLGPTQVPLLAAVVGPGSMTDMTEFLRSDKVSGFPQSVVACSVFFGHDGGGTYFGLPLTGEGDPFRWDPAWGEHMETCPEGIVSMWREVVIAYDFPTEVSSLGLPPVGTYRGGPQRIDSGVSSRHESSTQSAFVEVDLFDIAP